MAKVILKDMTSGDEVSIPVNVKVLCFEGHLQLVGAIAASTIEEAADKLAADGGARGIEACYSHELARGETALVFETSTGLWWPSEKL